MGLLDIAALRGSRIEPSRLLSFVLGGTGVEMSLLG